MNGADPSLTPAPLPPPPERPKRPPGYPKKLTPPVQARLIEAIARGVPIGHACAAMRIGHDCFSRFRNAHPDFEKSLQEAIAAAIEKRLKVVEDAAGRGDTGCARWLLEHLHPQFFAKSRLEITGAEGAPLTGAVALYLPKKESPEQATEIEGVPERMIADGNGH